MKKKYLCSIDEAITEIQKGNMLIVVDGKDRENQADLVFAGQYVDSQKINFMIRQAGGLICVPITPSQAASLNLPLMVAKEQNTEKTRVNFTVSVDAKDVESFGASVDDKVKTIRLLADPVSKPGDLVRPGHVFPLVARGGGVLERPGHTEATVDLLRIAGLRPCGVLSEILNRDGSIARLPEIIKFAKKYDLKILAVEELVKFLKKNPLPKVEAKNIVKVAESSLKSQYGVFKLMIYRSLIDAKEHVVVMAARENDNIPVRIHSKCFTGDTLMSLRCDCRPQLEKALEFIAEKKQGAIIYLDQEGRGIGLTLKVKAYRLQERGFDTVEAHKHLGLPPDLRDYQIAADILKDLGIKSIRLLTNNPQKLKQLEEHGIKVNKRIPLEIPPNRHNRRYLRTKKNKLGHKLQNV